jgi:hypothetical protein
MPFVQVQQLGEDLVRLQLDLHRALTDRTSQDVTVRSRKLAELRVTSPMDLRVLVSQLRSTRIASEVLSRARRVASLIYPNLPATLPRPDLAAVLAAAAAEHDRKALVRRASAVVSVTRRRDDCSCDPVTSFAAVTDATESS